MKVKTLKGLENLPDEMKKLFYDPQALYNILSDPTKLNRIKKSIEEGKATWNDDKVFHVTELIGCLTKAYFLRRPPKGFTKEQIEPSLQTLYYFFRGNIFDIIFSMAMPTSQVDFNIAVENPEGLDISIVGRTDWLDVDVKTQSVIAVNDLKTTKNLWYVSKEGAKQDHYYQVLAYSHIFGTEKVRIYYLDLGDLIVKEFDLSDKEIKDDRDKVIKALKERAYQLFVALKEQNPIWPPEIDPSDKDEGWRCKPEYCPFSGLCHPTVFPKHDKPEYQKERDIYFGTNKANHNEKTSMPDLQQTKDVQGLPNKDPKLDLQTVSK